MQAALKSFMLRKYHGYRLYLHNFSNFDSVFLLKNIVHLSNNVKPLMRDGRFINVKFSFAKYHLFIRDSYLLLPHSLRKLSNHFGVDNIKSHFPHSFVNDSSTPLNYNGIIPGYNYWQNSMSEEEFKQLLIKFQNNSWNYKQESIAYCTA